MNRLENLARRLLLHRFAMFSAGILLLLILFTISAPIIETLLGTDISKINLFSRFLSFSAEHPLGTDELGRDLLVRLAYGGRISLIVGFTAAIFAAVIGTTVGLVAGYYGGWIDSLLMRTTDSVIALPLLPLLIVLAVIDLGKLGIPPEIAYHEDVGLYRIIVIVSLVGWTGVARLVRGSVLSMREQPYILAAHALGVPPSRVIVAHILPGLASPIICCGHSVGRKYHSFRVNSQFSRAWHSSPNTELGKHAHQCSRVDMGSAKPSFHSGVDDLRYSYLVQLSG